MVIHFVRGRIAVSAGATAIALALLGEVALSIWAYRREFRHFTVIRKDSDKAVAMQLLPLLTEITFPSVQGQIVGWYVPGTRRAAVIVAHGFGGAREDMLPEIRILAKHGFGVLAFDWPGQGQSSGKVTMSAPDRAAVTSAIDWLSSRSDIDAYRIGVFGFSAGGYLVGQTALLDKRIRAIAIAGTMPSFASRLTLIYKRFGPLAQWAARYADKVYGLDLAELVLSERIHELSCPLLVVAGTNDPLVPEESAVINFINGPIPKEYFLVPGAHHGDYSEIAPVQYEQKLAAFYERWLLDH